MFKINYVLLIFVLSNCVNCNVYIGNGKMKQLYAWKQLGYDFNGTKYIKDADRIRSPGAIHFVQELGDSEKFFIQYNNVPTGIKFVGDLLFLTVPRRRFGIPSTLNYIDRRHSKKLDPLLKPYPNPEAVSSLTSVYRTAIDSCARLWMVDTGLLEVPGARRQVKPPAILAYNWLTHKLDFRYELDPKVLVNERTPGGLTSLTIDVEPTACGEAHAYITDLATNGLIVFSLGARAFWRIDHPSFVHGEKALNFTVAGNVISWKDGLFSIALSDVGGKRLAYYHPMVSTHEYAIDTAVLKNGGADFDKEYKVLGSRGPLSQSGIHSHHAASSVLFYANVARDGIVCWNTKKPLVEENVALIVQDREKLLYITDLAIRQNELYVLVNKMPVFVFSMLNKEEYNFFMHSGQVYDLIKGTVCDN